VDPSVIAATLAITLAVYLLITDWVDLAPWNNVEDLPRRQKILISIANYTPLALIAIAVVQTNVVIVALALAIGLVDLTMHVAYWWIPYLRGATAAHRTEHERLFAGTATFLPPIGDHPIPNTQHVLVGLLMLSMVVATVASLVTVAG
jgi:hypothetical protein